MKEYSKGDLLNQIQMLEERQLMLEKQICENARSNNIEDELLELNIELNVMTSHDFSIKLDLALKRIGRFLSPDRAYIFELDTLNNTVNNTYEWCNEGIPAEIHNLQDIPVEAIPMWMSALETQEYIYIPSLESLPETWNAERAILEPQGIKSLLVIPILLEKKLIGFVGFDELKKQKVYSPFEIKTLKIWTGLLAGLINNKQLELKVEHTKANYENLFNTIDDFLVILDEDGTIIHINDSVKKRLGYTEDELKGCSVFVLHPPHRKKEAEKVVEEMLQGERDFCPIPLLTKKGIQIPVETRVKHGLWDGKPAILGVSKDISQLTLSEEKFSKVFYVNPSACGLSDLENGKYVEVNPAFLKLFEYTQEEVIGKTAAELEIMNEETKNRILSGADKSGRVMDAEAELFTKNKAVKNVLLSSDNIYIQDKKYRYTVVNDITTRKMAEESLKEQNQKVNAIISASPDGIGIIDLDGRLEFISDKLATMYGFSADEKDQFIGKSILEFCNPTDHQKLMEIVSDMMMGKKEKNINQYQVIKKDKSNFDVDVNSTLINSFKGGSPHILFVQRDITEKLKTEQALIDSEAHLKTLIKTIPDLVWLKDINGVYLSCNKMFEHFYGFPVEEIIGKTDYDFTDKETADFFRKQDKKAIEAGQSVINEEWVIFANDGHKALLETTKTPMYDDKGKLIGVLGIGHDITERKNYEIELKEKEIQLSNLNASKDKFFSIIAHDLKSPFTGIASFSKLLAEEVQEGDYENIIKYANIISESSERTLNLISNLLKWAQAQRKSLIFEPKKIEINVVIKEVIDLLATSARLKSIALVAEVPYNFRVFADIAMVNAILRNLIANAIKFTQPEGHIIVSTRREMDFIITKVQDNGVGMDREQVEKLFRIDEVVSTYGTHKEKGSGLGLIIVEEYVKKNGGKIWVESEERKGTSVYFALPHITD